MARREKEIKRGFIPSKRRRGNVSVQERLSVLDRAERHAVLATDSSGQPYTSLITYALLPGFKGVVFATPKVTFKYKNILDNHRVALLIDNRSNREEGLMEAEAITIVGTARPIRRGKKWEELAKILIRKHPNLSKFVRSPSTVLVLIEATRCFHVGQFQTVSEWDVNPKAKDV